MKQKRTSNEVNVHIGGDVSGQLAIGNNILQIGDIHGGIVNIIQPEQKPNYTRRKKPVLLRPRAFPGLLDREAEVKSAVGVLQIPDSLSISGEEGIGKTALLRHLAYNAPADNFPDGIIFLSARGQPADDLLQAIFEAFYDCDHPAKPTTTELQHFLQNLKALILMDDLKLENQDISHLLNHAPQCTFIFASVERCLWGEGYCLEVHGLPPREASALLERELSHPISPNENPNAEELCCAAGWNPLNIIQAAAMIRQGMPIHEAAEQFKQSADALARQTMNKLTTPQRKVLALLAAAGGSSIPLKHLQTVSHIPDLNEVLKSLLELRLVQSHSPAFSVAGPLALSVGRMADVGGWENILRDHLVGWISENPPLPDVLDALDLTLTMLEKCNREHRWDDVIKLGRGIEKALTHIKRWSEWLRVLEMILNAAKALGNRATQGWAMHQLGTRDLCLGNLDKARETLTQALKIREAIGDKAAAAVTRHNLNLLLAPPAPPRETPRSGPKSGPKPGGSSLLKVFFGLATVTAVVIFILLQPGADEPPNVDPIPIATTKAPPPQATTQKPPTPKPPTQKPPTKKPPTQKPPTAVPTKTLTKTPTKTPTEPPMVCRTGVWYCEDFEDQKAQSWELAPLWDIQYSTLLGTGHDFAMLNDYSWADFRVQFDFLLDSGTIHLNYRILPASNGLRRYFIGVNAEAFYLQRQDGQTPYELVHEPWQNHHYQFQTGIWHHVDIAGWGGHLVFIMDGVTFINYVDEGYISKGSIAFETLDNSVALVDNIEVEGAGVEPQLPVIQTIYPYILSCESQNKILGVTADYDYDRIGMDYDARTYYTLDECMDACISEERCMAYTFRSSDGRCWLKEGKPEPTYGQGLVSGIKACVDPIE